MAITKTTVTHSLISPSEDPVQRGGTIQLGGFVGREWRDIQGMTADGQVITWEPANAVETGSWSVDLIPNADVANPANTLYRYLPAQGQPVIFEVKRGGPFTLAELVVTDPAQWPGLTPTTVGPAGPANTLTPGTATTGAPGTAMSFDITGDAPNQTLNVTIPRGDPGEAATVAVDPNPITGAPGTDVAVENTGDSHAAVLKFTVPRGDAGPAATVEVDSTTTGAPGTSAAVQNVGTTSAAKLKFTVPRGDIGPGATVAVGTTTTGAPGTNATVGNAGTPTAAVLNFVIPRGDSGNPGPGLNFQGNVATSANLPATGDIGDAWLADDTSHVWAWGDAAAGSASAYEYWGQGRPDVAGSLDAGGTAWVAAATQGAVFHSTTGDQGAQVWTKTAAGWVVTVGDTGWRNLSGTTAIRGTWTSDATRPVLLRRQVNLGLLNGIVRGGNANQFLLLPSGFVGASGLWQYPISSSGTATTDANRGKPLTIYDTGYVDMPSIEDRTIDCQYAIDAPWPTTLPGSPA